MYRISANSFRGNYSFLKLFGQRSQYISIKFPLHKPSENRGNYSREETIQGQETICGNTVYLILKDLSWEICNVKSKNCQKIVIKAWGHILYGSIFNASDVMFRRVGMREGGIHIKTLLRNYFKKRTKIK